MADEESGGAPKRKSIAEHAKEDPLSHLLRFLVIVVMLPVIGWLIVNKLDSIDSRMGRIEDRLSAHDTQLGLIVANQSAGQAQRDAQQKQIDGITDWLKNIISRGTIRGH